MALDLRELSDDLYSICDLSSLESIRPITSLTEWSLGEHKVFHLKGRVRGHPVLTDGRQIESSQVFFFDSDRCLARTLSRWYRLGAQSNDDSIAFRQ